MIADLNNIALNSDFFANIICLDKPLKLLKDATLYFFADDKPLCDTMVIKVQNSIAKSTVKSFWHLPYYIETLQDYSILEQDNVLLHYMETPTNFIMPLVTPDRSCKCYFVGYLKDLSDMENVFAFLSVDAQRIYDECTFAAFITTIESDLESAKKIWLRLIDYNRNSNNPNVHNISFKGKLKDAIISNYTFLGPGFATSIKSKHKITYSELVSKLRKFPETIEELSKPYNSDLQKESKMDYIKICDNLSEVDKNELILELSKRIKSKTLIEEAINVVIDKGLSCKLEVKIIKSNKIDPNINKDNRRKNPTWLTYLIDTKNNKQVYMNFEPTAHVIYVMNLIHRQNNPSEAVVLNVKENREAFDTIYNILYTVYPDKIFNKLFNYIEKEDGSVYKSKALNSCYRIITNCVNLCCTSLGESPSPYLTDANKPLTLNPDQINITDFKEFICIYLADHNPSNEYKNKVYSFINKI